MENFVHDQQVIFDVYALTKEPIRIKHLEMRFLGLDVFTRFLKCGKELFKKVIVVERLRILLDPLIFDNILKNPVLLEKATESVMVEIKLVSIQPYSMADIVPLRVITMVDFIDKCRIKEKSYMLRIDRQDKEFCKSYIRVNEYFLFFKHGFRCFARRRTLNFCSNRLNFVSFTAFLS